MTNVVPAVPAVVLTNRSKFRNWIVVVNNPTLEEQEFWYDISNVGHERIMWVNGQGEWPLGGQYHYQMYMEMKGLTRLSTMKNVFGRRVHFERRFGSQKEAKEYAEKEDSRFDAMDVRVNRILNRVPFKIEWGVLKRVGGNRQELFMKEVAKGEKDFELSVFLLEVVC